MDAPSVFGAASAFGAAVVFGAASAFGGAMVFGAASAFGAATGGCATGNGRTLFERRDARGESLERRILARENITQQRGLELEPRVAARTRERECVAEGTDRAQHHRLRDPLRLARRALGVVRRQIACEQRRIDARHQQVAKRRDQRTNQNLQIAAGIARLLDDG